MKRTSTIRAAFKQVTKISHGERLPVRPPRSPLPSVKLIEDNDKRPRLIRTPRVELLDSPLWGDLFDKEHARNGTWIPTWLVKAFGTEARARVGAELAWWFDPAFADQRKIERQPKRRFRLRSRARVYDQEGQQWAALPTRSLAERTMLPQRTVVDATKWLERNSFFLVDREASNGLRFRPVAESLARAFYEYTRNAAAFREFLAPHAERPLEWTGSKTQVHAFHNAPGITVHNVLIPIVGGDHFLARMLSQILYRFGDRRRACRARIQIHGNLWWAESHGTLAWELGVSPKTAQRGVASLINFDLIHTCVRPYRQSGDFEARWITHLRPNVERLHSRVKEVLAANRPSNRNKPNQ